MFWLKQNTIFKMTDLSINIFINRNQKILEKKKIFLKIMSIINNKKIIKVVLKIMAVINNKK